MSCSLNIFSEIITLSSEDDEHKALQTKTPIKRIAKLKKPKVSKKDDKQPLLKNYFKRDKEPENYFKCHKSSCFPAIVLDSLALENINKCTIKTESSEPHKNVDVEEFLQIKLEENDKSLKESDLQPRQGIVLNCITEGIENIPHNNVLLELEKRLYNAQDFDKQQWNMENKLEAIVSEDDEDDIKDTSSTNNKTKKKKKIICPKYKIIDGSKFAVDAFRYGEISHVEDYFLTHYHADHYIGLTKKFCHTLYLSEITGILVKAFIGVDEKYFKIVKVNEPFYLNKVQITPMDANHCPGALLFLFQFPDGRNVLHTGDFRATDGMSKQLDDWNCKLDLVYLDTTYLHTKRRFPSQSESIAYALEKVQQYICDNIGERFLIVCGSYLIGKEKIWTSIAKTFNFKVFLEKERLKAFKCLCYGSLEHLKFINQYVTEDMQEADILVTNMLNLSYPKLKEFIRDHQDSYNTILGVVASGWESQKYSQGRISLLNVQYSEHSSYTELERFIAQTKPKDIISTVPVRMDQSITSEIPSEWLGETVKLRKKVNQTKLIRKKSSPSYQAFKNT